MGKPIKLAGGFTSRPSTAAQ